MQQKHKKQPRPPQQHNIKGFSLIEFLVAAALSMIVMMAISSTYFTARNLNNTASTRLSVQQDLRNAANMIVRDARMAGSFGCFNMAVQNVRAVIADTAQNTVFGLTASRNGSTVFAPVSIEAAKDFQASGFTVSGNALIFKYGALEGENPTPAVISSCNQISRTSGGISTNAVGTSTLRYAVNAYVVGTPANGRTGLYRFQYNGTGWGNPQLLVRDISTMDIRSVYAQDNACTSFTRETGLKADGSVPALIQLTFNNQIAAGNQKDIQIQTYNIDAAVRGGNKCAETTI